MLAVYELAPMATAHTQRMTNMEIAATMNQKAASRKSKKRMIITKGTKQMPQNVRRAYLHSPTPPPPPPRHTTPHTIRLGTREEEGPNHEAYVAPLPPQCSQKSAAGGLYIL